VSWFCRIVQGALIAGLWVVSSAPRQVKHRKVIQAILFASLGATVLFVGKELKAGIGNLSTILLLAPLVLPTVMIHEVSHGWAALQLGDPTAKEKGRLTFNPVKHMSFKWTVLLPISVYYLFGVPLILPKPVPINPRNFEHPRKGIMLVGLAGPAVNIFLMLFFALVLGSEVIPNGGVGSFVREVLIVLIVVNMVLAMFNLMPIPPLDGSRFLIGVLPARHAHFMMRVQILGLLFIFALVIGTHKSVGIDAIVRPCVEFVWRMLGLDVNELRAMFLAG